MISRIVTYCVILILLSELAVCPASASLQTSERITVLNLCRSYYGSAADEKQNLFTVNDFYVLRVKFDRRGRLEELAVEPKYFFDESHPEWTEPANFEFLTKAEYDALLTRLDEIKPKGKLVKPRSVSAGVTNQTAHHLETYQHGVLKWGELVDIRRAEDAPLRVRWLNVFYSK